MSATERPSTPPAQSKSTNHASNMTPITPEQVRRMEESRLRAKALRAQREHTASLSRQNSGLGGTKRPHSAISAVPATSRDARLSATPGPKPGPGSNNGLAESQDMGIRPAKKFQKYVEYDFSKMTDTKGGFMTQEDDPFNKALHTPNQEDKPEGMTLKEWDRLQLQKKLRQQKAGPYEPGLSVLDKVNAKKCRECGSMEIDFRWDEVLNCQVCHLCKDKFPEKYSLLTKSECKNDYLLTDPELKDEELLPRMEKPNPHKATWHNMMLFLRYQVEEYAFSDKKWGSEKGLDEEYERRQTDAKNRKEKKFRNKLNELKKRTRVDAYKRALGGGGGKFGDTIGSGKHEHEWGRPVEDPETGMTKKACIECGMEVEEMDL